MALTHASLPPCLASPESTADNLALAFRLAEDYFGIDRILDVEDLEDSLKPDEKIVIT